MPGRIGAGDGRAGVVIVRVAGQLLRSIVDVIDVPTRNSSDVAARGEREVVIDIVLCRRRGHTVQPRRVVVFVADLRLILRSVRDVHPGDEADDTAVQVSLAEIVIGESITDEGSTICCILVYDIREPIRRKGAVINYS